MDSEGIRRLIELALSIDMDEEDLHEDYRKNLEFAIGLSEMWMLLSLAASRDNDNNDLMRRVFEELGIPTHGLMTVANALTNLKLEGKQHLELTDAVASMTSGMIMGCMFRADAKTLDRVRNMIDDEPEGEEQPRPPRKRKPKVREFTDRPFDDVSLILEQMMEAVPLERRLFAVVMLAESESNKAAIATHGFRRPADAIEMLAEAMDAMAETAGGSVKVFKMPSMPRSDMN